MILLGARLYDPAVAVNKVTTAAIAMTALDTTNLRLAFTVPAHGMVRVRLAGSLHGAATFPSILLGVMEGATVRGRVSPQQTLGNTAVATAQVRAIADFIIPGLTPGAVTWDAAYGVETLVASTGLKYGGPNNTTANDAFGAFQFEVWDPAPTSIATVGTVTGNVNGSVAVVNDLANNAIDAASFTTGTLMDAAGIRAAVGLASANLDTQLAGGGGGGPSAAAISAQVWNDCNPDKIFGYTP